MTLKKLVLGTALVLTPALLVAHGSGQDSTRRPSTSHFPISGPRIRVTTRAVATAR